MKTEDSVMQHVANVQNMASQLKDAGQNMNEVEIMAKILGSLPSKYNTFITAWDSVPLADQKIGVLLERLIKEENRLKVESEATSAFSAVSIGERKFKNAKDIKNKGQTDHKTKSKVECFYCKKKGHIARECYKKQRDKCKQTDKTDGQSAFVATISKQGGNRLSTPTHREVQELSSSNMEDVWITDSGASRHMTYRREWLFDFQPINGEVVSLGNGGQCKVAGSGTVFIHKLVDGDWTPAKIENVLLVPDIKRNLFSVGACTNKGYSVLFSGHGVTVKRQGNVHAIGQKQSNDIFRLFFKVTAKCSKNEANVTCSDLRTWHERLGHINAVQLKKVDE